MNWNFKGLDLLGAIRDVQTDYQICKIAINHNNGGDYWKKRYNRMLEVANNLRKIISYDDTRYSEPFSTEKYAIDEPEKEEQEVRIKQKIHDVTFHLDVEPNYNEPTEGKGKNDAVTFTVGQYTDKYNSLDASVSSTVEDARAFAEAILKACDDIEGIEEDSEAEKRTEEVQYRKKYIAQKSKQLDKITDAHKYTRRLARVMQYHRMLTEIEIDLVRGHLKNINRIGGNYNE